MHKKWKEGKNDQRQSGQRHDDHASRKPFFFLFVTLPICAVDNLQEEEMRSAPVLLPLHGCSFFFFAYPRLQGAAPNQRATEFAQGQVRFDIFFLLLCPGIRGKLVPHRYSTEQCLWYTYNLVPTH